MIEQLIRDNACINMRLDTKINNQQGRYWLAMRQIIFAVTDLRSRSGTFTNPWNSANVDLYRVPELKHIPDRLSDLVDARTIELNQIALATGRRILIQWSGGIDSTMILASFIKNLSSADIQNVSVILTLSSIAENFDFYRDHIAGRIDCINWLDIAIDNEFLDSNILIHGDPADCLFGPSTAMYERLIPTGEHLQPYQNHLKLIAKSIEIRNINKIKKLNVAGFGTWYVNKITRNLEQSAPAGVETIADWWWWHYFNFKWQFSIIRPFMRRRTNGIELIPLRTDAVADYLNNTYFNTDLFQQWSYSNLPYHVGYDIRNHKRQAKEYIYELDHNPVYLEHKIKMESAPIYDHYDHAQGLKIDRAVLWDQNWQGYYKDHPGLTSACIEYLEQYKG
jgi:hypothetical protein